MSCYSSQHNVCCNQCITLPSMSLKRKLSRHSQAISVFFTKLWIAVLLYFCFLLLQRQQDPLSSHVAARTPLACQLIINKLSTNPSQVPHMYTYSSSYKSNIDKLRIKHRHVEFSSHSNTWKVCIVFFLIQKFFLYTNTSVYFVVLFTCYHPVFCYVHLHQVKGVYHVSLRITKDDVTIFILTPARKFTLILSVIMMMVIIE